MWAVPSLGLLQIKLLQTFVCTYAFMSLGRIPTGGTAGSYGKHTVNFSEIAKLFSKTIVPFCPHQKFMKVTLIYLLTNTWYGWSVILILAILTGCMGIFF